MDIFDENMALEKVDGNRELMLELFAMMIKDLPQHIEQLELSIINGSQDEQWNIAHKLTGSTAYCGIPALQATARALENSIKSKLPDIQVRFDEVKREADRLLLYYRDNLA